MRFRVRHRVRYRYDAPVALGPHVLRLTPRNAAGMAHGIQVTPKPAFRLDETDAHGNLVTRLGFAGATPTLEIEARFELDTHGLVRPHGANVPPERYLLPGMADAAVAATAARLRALAGPDPAGFADSLAATLQSAIAFDAVDTAPLRNPGETLARGRGSARDIAALFVDLSRRAGLPARFVTGYWAETAHPATARGARSWPEVLLPDVGWQGYDPILGIRTGEGHVAVAAAADLAGTLPVTGSTFGAGIRVSTDVELNVMTRG
ncbi:MAG TPA: transglutaminase family protein [Rhodobacteraceae bacterium]|nr:transglutaminase family protein [Paracoccaceae bacterium]